MISAKERSKAGGGRRKIYLGKMVISEKQIFVQTPERRKGTCLIKTRRKSISDRGSQL